MDVWGDHALTCACGGERTVRHNGVRNVFYEEALEGGLRPEREKAGLLPARPAEDNLPQVQGLRRPADVWVPRNANGKGEAFDFAVSCGLQSNLFHPSAETPGLVFQRYEEFKRTYKDTAQLCEARGFVFTPMVLEAHGGGWSPLMRAAVDWIAKRQAACHNEDPCNVSLKIAQRISCSLVRDNARAILQRSGATLQPSHLPSGWDEAVEP